jgi:hypothetical protein
LVRFFTIAVSVGTRSSSSISHHTSIAAGSRSVAAVYAASSTSARDHAGRNSSPASSAASSARPRSSTMSSVASTSARPCAQLVRPRHVQSIVSAPPRIVNVALGGWRTPSGITIGSSSFQVTVRSGRSNAHFCCWRHPRGRGDARGRSSARRPISAAWSCASAGAGQVLGARSSRMAFGTSSLWFGWPIPSLRIGETGNASAHMSESNHDIAKP